MTTLKELRVALVGTLTAVVTALVCAWLFRTIGYAHVVPFLFLIVLFGIARRFGAKAGFIGTILAAFLFALLLFPPLGSIQIRDRDAALNLQWMLIGGIVISGLVSAHSSNSAH